MSDALICSRSTKPKRYHSLPASLPDSHAIRGEGHLAVRQSTFGWRRNLSPTGLLCANSLTAASGTTPSARHVSCHAIDFGRPFLTIPITIARPAVQSDDWFIRRHDFPLSSTSSSSADKRYSLEHIKVPIRCKPEVPEWIY